MMLHTAKRRPCSDDAHQTQQHLYVTTTDTQQQQPGNLPPMIGSDSGYDGSSSSIGSGGGASCAGTRETSPLALHNGESQKLSSKHRHDHEDFHPAHRCGSNSMGSSLSGSASGSASLASIAEDHNSERGSSAAAAAAAAWCCPSKVAQRRSDAAAAESALEPRPAAAASSTHRTLAEARTPPRGPTLEAAATCAMLCQPTASAAAADSADDTSPRYSLIRKLGSGAMANVWLARDRIENNHKALKVITNKDFFEAGRREFAIGHRIRHPNLVPSFRCLQTPHKLVIVERACTAELFSLVTASVGCDETRARRAMADVLCGLEYLHSNAGICHRDIKPENILLDSESGALIGDYGSAALIGSASKCGPGTLPYLPPEAACGRPYSVDASLDMWSFGITLFVLLAGDFPWTKPRRSDPDFASFCNGERRHVAWKTFSQPMRQVLDALLHVDPKARPTPAEIRPLFELPWFTPEVAAQRRRYFQQAEAEQQRKLALRQQHVLIQQQQKQAAAHAQVQAAAAACVNAHVRDTSMNCSASATLSSRCQQVSCGSSTAAQHQHQQHQQLLYSQLQCQLQRMHMQAKAHQKERASAAALAASSSSLTAEDAVSASVSSSSAAARPWSPSQAAARAKQEPSRAPSLSPTRRKQVSAASPKHVRVVRGASSPRYAGHKSVARSQSTSALPVV